MAFIRVEPDDGPAQYVLPGGSQISETDSPEDLLEVVIARLRASNKAAPARPKSVAVQRAEEALFWLLALKEGRSR